MKTSYAELHANITTPQIRKLAKGENIQLKHEQIGHGLKIHLSHGMVKKMMNAKKKMRGTRLKMSPEEIHMNGEGIFKNIKKAANKVGKFVKNNVVPVAKKVYSGYQKHIKPIVSPLIREGLTKALPIAVGAAATALGQPELAVPAAAIASRISSPLVNSIGNATGAYGLKKPRRKRFVLRTDRSTMVHSYHPAMTPALPLPDFSKPDYQFNGGRLTHYKQRPTRGGSFMPAGY
jgi:hypothetical protein